MVTKQANFKSKVLYKYTPAFVNTYCKSIFRSQSSDGFTGGQTITKHFYVSVTKAAETKPAIEMLHFVGNHGAGEGRTKATSAGLTIHFSSSGKTSVC